VEKGYKQQYLIFQAKLEKMFKELKQAFQLINKSSKNKKKYSEKILIWLDPNKNKFKSE